MASSSNNSNKFSKLKRKSDAKDDDVPHCAHWMYKRKRFCRMGLVRGFKFCGEHMPVTKQPGLEKFERIKCPLDNGHTVYANKLQKHLKICNSRIKKDQPAYVVPGINAGETTETAEFLESCIKIKLCDLEDEEFYALIDKVKSIYAENVDGTIKSVNLQHKSLDDELANEEYGKETRKHLLQTSSLLGVMEDTGILQNNTSFVEFGAGKGKLAYYLALLLSNYENCQVVLLDRMSVRHKTDNKFKNTNASMNRIKIDIADFKIQLLPLLQENQRIVAFSKHLCGGATDLALRCINQNTAEQKLNEQDRAVKVGHVMIAVCCHHRCDWRSFVGKEFLQSQGIDARQFTLLTKMASWAICGSGMSRERRRQITEKHQTTATAKANIKSNIYNDDGNFKQRLSLEEREKIGLMCKRVLDYARMVYLRNNGYEASLIYYVDKDVTLENVCLMANINNPA